jgi:type IV fimbrial biogenesis protein FimT
MRTVATGFTIVELLIVLAVAAVLSSVGLPALTRLSNSNHMVAEINQLAMALHLARNEALKRGANVEICTAREDNSGVVQCDDTAYWNDGWVVYPASTPGTRITVFNGFSSNDTLQSLGGFKTISFNRYGFSTQKDTLVLCPPDADEKRARALLLEPSGRVVAADYSGGDGIVDDIDGNNVTCPLVN